LDCVVLAPELAPLPLPPLLTYQSQPALAKKSIQLLEHVMARQFTDANMRCTNGSIRILNLERRVV